MTRLYTVAFSAAADRDFDALPCDVKARLRPKIEALARDPRPAGVKKLAGSEDLWRIRVADHRIVYQIRDRLLLVLVIRIGHRREVYR